MTAGDSSLSHAVVLGIGLEVQSFPGQLVPVAIRQCCVCPRERGLEG